MEKTFNRSFRGYDENEVDKFLDQIIDELKALQNDNAALKEALDAEAERARKIKDTEETIMHTLVTAQKSAERILSEAARKAELIIDNAQTTAKRRSEQTTRDLKEAQSKLEEVKQSARGFASSFAEMINKEAASFEKIYRGYFGDMDSGISLKALEKIDEDIAKSLTGMSSEEEPSKLEKPEPEKPEPEKPEPEKTKPKKAKAVVSEDNEPDSLLEFTEINKALSEIENGGEDVLQDSYEEVPKETAGAKDKPKPAGFEPKYDDYSWLYGSDDSDDAGVSFKDPKEKEELESLIDDIIE